MTYTVFVREAGVQFECADGETVLDAAEQAGFSIPYSCRKGVCSSCEGAIVQGEAMVRGQGLCVGPMESVRLCQARPRTDLEIAPVRIRKVEPITRKTLEAKVHRIEWPADDIAVLKLRFPNGVRAVFEAGQYLRVIMPDGDSRNYSMANPPQQNTGCELHIRRVPGGAFSEGVLSGLAKGSLLTVELPFGEFTCSAPQGGKSILIATGTGFAPLNSIVEDRIRNGETRPMHLFWGARSEADLYDRKRVEGWAARHDWFSFTPVVSEPAADWAGRTGNVHEAVLEDYPDMTGLDVYACGAPVMIDAAFADFTGKAGLPEQRFHSDAFVSTAAEPETDAP